MRIALIALVALLIISAAIGISIILLGAFTDTEIRILASSGALSVYTALMMPSLFHLKGNKYPYLTRLTAASTSITLIMFLLLIWESGPIEGTFSFIKILASVTVLAIATNHCLVLLIVRPNKLIVRMFQNATIVVIALMAIFFILGIWNNDMIEALLRVFLTLAVLDALGSIATPLLYKATR